VKQVGSTSDLVFSIREIVASCSEGRTLSVGDLILTGTPEGVGFTRQPPEFLSDGDVVAAEIEGIGVLTNTVRFQANRVDVSTGPTSEERVQS
jgi:acylpyruvate hydrolase